MSNGYKNIPIFLIKLVAEYILSLPAFIINNQILTWMFSKTWNISSVCSIPKVNKPETPADYGPNSVLPILAKVYERVKWPLYIEKKITYHYQSGYRKTHSTLTILIKLGDDIEHAIKIGAKLL